MHFIEWCYAITSDLLLTIYKSTNFYRATLCVESMKLGISNFLCRLRSISVRKIDYMQDRLLPTPTGMYSGHVTSLDFGK